MSFRGPDTTERPGALIAARLMLSGRTRRTSGSASQHGEHRARAAAPASAAHDARRVAAHPPAERLQPGRRRRTRPGCGQSWRTVERPTTSTVVPARTRRTKSAGWANSVRFSSEAVRAFAAEHHLANVDAQNRRRAVPRSDRRDRETSTRPVQTLRHARVLRALPGEHERDSPVLVVPPRARPRLVAAPSTAPTLPFDRERATPDDC